MNSDWLSVASLLSDISRSMACSAFIHDGHVLKRERSVLSIKDKNEFADDKCYFTIKCRFLHLISFAGVC